MKHIIISPDAKKKKKKNAHYPLLSKASHITLLQKKII